MTQPTDNAFPSGNKPGLTAREYAALHLQYPDSGQEWTDTMILRAIHHRFMAAATGRSLEYMGSADTNKMASAERNAENAHLLANAMMDIHYAGLWDTFP